VESVQLVLGQVHVTAYFNQDEDIGEEDQVLIPFYGSYIHTYILYLQVPKGAFQLQKE